MTPKEKAEDLVLRYLRNNFITKEWYNTEIAKQCALIATDKIIEALQMHNWQNKKEIDYYREVEQEIEKL